MIKSLVVAVALTIGLAGHAVAGETVHHHHQHWRHHFQPAPWYPDPQAGPPAEAPDIYWSPAGGNPIHYAQTTGYYAGR